MAKVDGSRTYIGVVEDNNDPLKLGRARIRVLDVFDNLKTEDIPFATPWKDINGNKFTAPEKGKVLLVVFDSGDEHKPEFICAEHYNINLEKKLKSLSSADYLSMSSLLFDHKTQIYVNDKEGLKIDHKYNNINITENTIDLNLKDNNRHVNIGDATAGQQAILGNHWLDWFDEFVDNLMGNKGGPYLGNLGAPVVTNPAMIQVLMKYKQLRDPVFLSHHVNIVDNNKVSTVKNTPREDTPQIGDSWVSTKKDNDLTSKTNENFKPVDGPKPEYNDKHVEPSTTPTTTTTGTPLAATGQGASASTTNGVTNTTTQGAPVVNGSAINTNPPAEPLSSTTSNPKIDKLISFLKSKKYRTYDQIGVLNIVAFQSAKKDDGSISNKFDDSLNVFYKNQNGNWELLEYQITTMPGYFPKTELLPEGVGLLALGQYADLCRLDTYTSDPTTTPIKTDKCLKIDEATIHINDSTKIYNYKSEKINVKSIVLLHKSSDVGSAESVFNYSGGAQVFKTVSQWDQFTTLCESQVTMAKKDTFTYTFCKQSEFDTFVPTTVDEPTTPKIAATTTTNTTTCTNNTTGTNNITGTTTPSTNTTTTPPTTTANVTTTPNAPVVTKPVITVEQKSFDDYKRIVKTIENIYKQGDRNFTKNNDPLFKSLKGFVIDNKTAAVDRIYELLGLKTMKIKQFWYNKLSISGLTTAHQKLFKNQLIGLRSATLGNNSFNFNLPTLKTGEGSKYVSINGDF